jgi:hypothetical protein
MCNTLMAYYHGIGGHSETLGFYGGGVGERYADEQGCIFQPSNPNSSVSSSGKQAGKPDTGGGPPD